MNVSKAMMWKSASDNTGLTSDESLLKAFTRGETQAFDELYSRYRQPLYSYLLRNCSSEPITNELFQDVWLAVVSSAARYKGRGRFRSWLFSIAHNRLIDYYRQASRHKDEEYTDSEANSCVIDQVANLQHQDLLYEVIATLPLDQRSALLLREDAGLSLKDIARIQGITLEAAKSRLRYAYRKLRDAITGIDW